MLPHNNDLVSLNLNNNEDSPSRIDDDSMIAESPLCEPIEIDDSTIECKVEVDTNSANLLERLMPSSSAEAKGVEISENMITDHENPSTSSNWYTTEINKHVLDEPLTTNNNTSQILDHDPMDLLELDCRDEMCDTPIENLTNNQLNGSDELDDETSTIRYLRNINNWAAKHAWFLHEDSDKYFGYCLYCDMNINLRSTSSVKKHALSLHHRERAENYLAFRDVEERSGLSTPIADIKEEFGTHSRIQALKLKRKTQAEALSNFNWRRWLKQHTWLQRLNTNGNCQGTVGFCKYCNIELNVEFLYVRQRHETSMKHKIAEKTKNDDTTILEQNGNYGNDDSETLTHDNDCNGVSSQKSYLNDVMYCQIIDNEPKSCRCIVCNIRMHKKSYLRHVRTKCHSVNLQQYCQNQKEVYNSNMDNSDQIQKSITLLKEEYPETESENLNNLCQCNAVDSSTYSDKHPWLNSYRNYDSYTRCSHCKKFLFYGKYMENVTSYGYSVNNECNETDEHSTKNVIDENCIENHNNEVTNEPLSESYSLNSSEKETNKSKRTSRSTTKLIGQYDWCKPSKINPNKYYFCMYCKKTLSKQSDRSNHATSVSHVRAEQKYLRNFRRQQMLDGANTTGSLLYPWAVHLNNVKSTYYCKYCKLTLSVNYRKEIHENSKNHITNAQLWKSKSSGKTNSQVNTVQNERLPSGNVVSNLIRENSASPSFESKIKLWQIKYPWLMCKRSEIRPNYAFCKVCRISVYARTSKNAAKHQRSSRHYKRVAFFRNQTSMQKRYEREQENGVSNMMEESVNTNVESEPLNIHEENYDSLDEDCHITDYDRDSEKSNTLDTIEDIAENGNNDVIDTEMTVHNDAQEANISDYHSEISSQDYQANLQKRSRNSCNKRNPISCETSCLSTKRLKRSRGDGGYHEDRYSTSMMTDILNTPLRLFNCLKPLIQQQIQESSLNLAQNLHQLPAEPAEHSFDLFFRSISETMKKMPIDLAAEGKVKIMEVICELELKALKKVTDEKSTHSNVSIVESPIDTITNAQHKMPNEIAAPTTTNNSASFTTKPTSNTAMSATQIRCIPFEILAGSNVTVQNNDKNNCPQLSMALTDQSLNVNNNTVSATTSEQAVLKTQDATIPVQTLQTP